MIRFDEKSFAEKMHDTQSFINTYGVTELTIYAKWLKYNKLKELEKDYIDLTVEENVEMDKYIERELIDFSERNYPSFNYVVNYTDIDRAVENSKGYKLRLPSSIPITKSEWESIMSIDNDNYRRILFVMLVDSKYYRLHGTSIYKEYVVDENTVFYNQMSDNEIIKTAKTKFANKEEKKHVWHYLYKRGLADITSGRLKARFVQIVDVSSDAEIIDYITDYDHLDLHYERLMGANIGTCKYCGRLFRQNKQNNMLYCYKHRGYQKKELRFGTCIDCGREFSVAANNQRKNRCDKCAQNYRIQYKSEKNKEYYQRKKSEISGF